MRTKSKTERRLQTGIFAIILLSCCLVVTTFAIVYATVSIENNYFRTGTVSINLNDGKPVIEEHEFLFEPGMTVKKDFFVENMSSDSIYYRLYFNNVSGGLADVLEVTITDGADHSEVLWQGLAKDITRQNAAAADDALAKAERRDLAIFFHFPHETGNSAMNLTLSFDLAAEAVQSINNPNKLFD